MVVHYYLSDTMINPELGGQYSLLDQTSTCSYPQVHDYHEIALTIKGTQTVTMRGRTILMHSGELLWIRPGEIHEKSGFVDCTQVNFAFTQKTVDSLICYFDSDFITQLLTSRELLPVIPLSVAQQAELQQRLDTLNFISSRDLPMARVQMRVLLSLVLEMFAQANTLYQADSTPMWLTSLLCELAHPGKLQSSLDDLSVMAQRSKAYISRSFKKYLGMTPTQYMNKIRLEYAENLLSHTDKAIVDIAMESGFENLSHFYHQFKRKNGISPMVYRRKTMVLPH